MVVRFRVPNIIRKTGILQYIVVQSYVKMIWKVCEWEENKTYRSDGRYYSEYILVEFDLTQAEIVLYDE